LLRLTRPETSAEFNRELSITPGNQASAVASDFVSDIVVTVLEHDRSTLRRLEGAQPVLLFNGVVCNFGTRSTGEFSASAQTM
jgi:hypothetical protein